MEFHTSPLICSNYRWWWRMTAKCKSIFHNKINKYKLINRGNGTVNIVNVISLFHLSNVRIGCWLFRQWQQMRNFVRAISGQLKRERHPDTNFTTDHSRSLLFCHVLHCGFLERKTDPLGYGFFRLEWMKFHYYGISRNSFGALSRIRSE